MILIPSHLCLELSPTNQDEPTVNKSAKGQQRPWDTTMSPVCRFEPGRFQVRQNFEAISARPPEWSSCTAHRKHVGGDDWPRQMASTHAGRFERLTPQWKPRKEPITKMASANSTQLCKNTFTAAFTQKPLYTGV